MKLICIIIFMLIVIVALFPISYSIEIDKNKEINRAELIPSYGSLISVSKPENVKNLGLNVHKSGGEIESGFMIGIMHTRDIKKGWGWVSVWTPIYIIEYISDAKLILGPSSGSFIPSDIDGFLGPAYSLYSNPYFNGPFFIYAYVEVWDGY